LGFGVFLCQTKSNFTQDFSCFFDTGFANWFFLLL
jgi:hypothetical protein